MNNNSIQSQNIAEKLGYKKDAKLLIIHADDLGLSHSENMASIKAMEDGCVNSASIMVTCPWFPEIADYAKKHKDMDFGVHLTITSEWEFYKWRPTFLNPSMTTYTNEQGYFYDNVADVVAKGNPDILFFELSSQVKLAMDSGVDVTHLDAHMGGVMATPEFLEAYIKTGRKFNLPVLLTNDITAIEASKIQALLNDNDIMVNNVFSAAPEDFKNGMEAYYTKTLNNLEPGLNCMLVHLAYEDEEMKAITTGHNYWGAKWRQQDFDFFTSEACNKLIKGNDIVLITWKEIRDKITRL